MDDALRLAFDSGLPYSGLRAFAPDPRLWHYVPLGYALEHGVVPVVLAGDVLHVAAATPGCDLSALRGIFPRLHVTLTLAPERELRATLSRANGRAA